MQTAGTTDFYISLTGEMQSRTRRLRKKRQFDNNIAIT